MLKFFRCVKCSWQTGGPSEVMREKMVCGAVVEYVPADNPDAGAENFVHCMGMKPLGCGGEMREITQEEALKSGGR